MIEAAIVVVWDIGKSNAKMCALNRTGELVAEYSKPLSSLPAPPYLHLDCEGLWSWALDRLLELGARFHVLAIVVVAHGATACLVDDELVLPVLDYEDSGPEECEEEYCKVRPSFDKTYSPALPGSLNFGRGIYWLGQKFPQEFAKTRHILSYAQYWSWRLSGIAASEVSSLGSHTDLWLPAEKQYSSLVKQLGWSKLLPPLRNAREILGPVRKEVALATGLPKDCDVYCGIHDSNASLVPWLSRQKPFTVISSGTWVINFAVGAPLEKLDPLRDCAANVTIDGTPVACSRWMGGREYANMTTDSDVSVTSASLQLCLDEAVMFVPPQGGQGGPFGASDASIIVSDVDRNLRGAAACLYCALALDYSLDCCGSCGSVIVEGPFATNKYIVAVLASLRPTQEILVSKDPTGTTAGAARMVLPNSPVPRVRKVEPYSADEKLFTYRRYWRDRAKIT